MNRKLLGWLLIMPMLTGIVYLVVSSGFAQMMLATLIFLGLIGKGIEILMEGF